MDRVFLGSRRCEIFIKEFHNRSLNSNCLKLFLDERR